MPAQYYINRNDKIRGPFSEERVRELYAEGKLRDTDLLSTRSDGAWEPARTVLNPRASKRASARVKAQSTSAMKGPRRALWIVLAVAAAALIGVGIWRFGLLQPHVADVEASTQETQGTVPALTGMSRELQSEASVNEPRDQSRIATLRPTGSIEERNAKQSTEAKKSSESGKLTLNYVPNEEFTLTVGNEPIAISITSQRHDARLLATILDFASSVGFQITLQGHGTLGTPTTFLEDQFTIQVSPPQKPFFSMCSTGSLALRKGNLEKLSQDVILVFAIHMFGVNRENQGRISLLHSTWPEASQRGLIAALSGDSKELERLAKLEKAIERRRKEQIPQDIEKFDHPRSEPGSVSEDPAYGLVMFLQQAIVQECYHSHVAGRTADAAMVNRVLKNLRDPLLQNPLKEEMFGESDSLIRPPENVGNTLEIARRDSGRYTVLVERVANDRKRLSALNNQGHLIVGRVQLEDGGSTDAVSGQMPILPGGFFADVIADSTKPIGFASTGYRPFTIYFSDGTLPTQDGIIDVGTIVLSKSPVQELSVLTGTVMLEEGTPAINATVSISPHPPHLNRPKDMRASADRSLLSFSVLTDTTGKFQLEGLSPGAYFIVISKEGYKSTSHNYVVVKVASREELPPREMPRDLQE